MTLSVVLIDLTTDVTPVALRPTQALLEALAQAMAEQVQGPFVAEYGRQDVTLSVVPSEQARCPGDVAMHFRDTLDVQGALAYHTEVGGIPDMEVGVSYCSSFGDEGESVTCSAGHELLETLVNPGANLWADSRLGYMTPKEVVDRVQNSGYRSSNGLWMPNFLRASAWVPGAAGPWDHLGLMKTQDDYSNGYDIRASPPNGNTEVGGRLGESIGHALGSVFALGSVSEKQLASRKSRYSRAHRLGVRF